MEIQFSGILDEPLIAQAVKLANQPTPVQRIFRIAMLVVIAAALGFVTYSTVTGTETQPTRWLRVLIWVALLAYFIYQPVLTQRRLTQKIWQSIQAQPRMEGAVTPDGVSFTFGDARQEIPWERFFRLRKSDEMTVLLTNNGLLSMFPRRFFPNSADWSHLHQVIDQHVKVAK